MSDREAANRNMRKASGMVDTNDPLVVFFYVLVRDKMTPGELELLLERVNLAATNHEFTNGWLAGYAKDVVSRLRQVVN